MFCPYKTYFFHFVIPYIFPLIMVICSFCDGLQIWIQNDRSVRKKFRKLWDSFSKFVDFCAALVFSSVLCWCVYHSKIAKCICLFAIGHLCLSLNLKDMRYDLYVVSLKKNAPPRQFIFIEFHDLNLNGKSLPFFCRHSWLS